MKFKKTVIFSNTEYNFMYLTLLLRTLGDCIKKKYCPTKKSTYTAGHRYCDAHTLTGYVAFLYGHTINLI